MAKCEICDEPINPKDEYPLNICWECRSAMTVSSNVYDLITRDLTLPSKILNYKRNSDKSAAN